MKRLVLAFSCIFVLILGLSGYIVLKFNRDFKDPGSSEKSQIIVIPTRSGLTQISEILAYHHLISDPFAFVWTVRFKGQARELKAGEYEFKAHISPEEIMNLLVSGKTYHYKFTVAEGLTTQEILKEIQQAEPLTGEISLWPKEGDLLPETYLFARGYSRQALINRMIDSQQDLLNQLWQNRSLECPFKTKEEAIIMASIIEKETGIAEERPLIAAVFINRLTKNMPLQSDPTISYVLHQEKEKPLNQGLSKEELKYDSLFNTYLHEGLPPSAICNPGKGSLLAVFHPALSDALYFVADGTGGHVFSTNLPDHQKNHAKWRKIRNEKKKSQRGSQPSSLPH